MGSGTRVSGITNRLHAEKKLDYDKALELAQAIESAEQNTKQLQSTHPPEAQLPTQPTGPPRVNHNTNPKKGRGQQRQPSKQSSPHMPCYRCGGVGHSPTQRKFKDAVCHACKNRGHIVKVCRSKRGIPKKAHHLEGEQTDSDSLEEGSYSICHH